MQVQKNYKIHNNNPVHPSAKLTQTICVNPYILQPQWKYCIIKQAMTGVSIIGYNIVHNHQKSSV